MNGMFNKNEWEKSKDNKERKRFILLTAITFIMLFIFSMVIAIAVNIGENMKFNEEEITVNGMEDMFFCPTILNQKETEAITKEETTKENSFAEIEPVVADEEENPENYTEDDLYYLAAAVCCEAGGENEEIQLLVANVVINRVNSSFYPDTIYDVLTEYGQYGMMWEYGIEFPDWADEGVKNQCYSVARRVLEGERFCPENVLFQAEFEQGSGIFKQFRDEYYFCYYD